MYRFVQMANMALMSAAEDGADEIVYGAGTMALYSVIGFLLVIAVLIILIVLLVAFSKILNGIKIKRKKEDVATAAVPAETASSEEESETVAAITAALMAYYETNITSEEKADVMPVPFVIRSIKKL